MVCANLAAKRHVRPNICKCDSAKQYASRIITACILAPAEADTADKLLHWVTEHGMHGVRCQTQATPRILAVIHTGNGLKG